MLDEPKPLLSIVRPADPIVELYERDTTIVLQLELGRSSVSLSIHEAAQLRDGLNAWLEA